jgi:hypothetical protein
MYYQPEDAASILKMTANACDSELPCISAQVEVTFNLAQNFRYSDMHKTCHNVGRPSLPSWVFIFPLSALSLEQTTARYFSPSANLDPTTLSAEGTGTMQKCGRCDNCLRIPSSYKTEDKTVESWQLLKIAEAACNLGKDLTVAHLGAHAAKKSTTQTTGAAEGDTEAMDVQEIAGGDIHLTPAVSCHSSRITPPVDCSHIKQERMILIVHLVIEGYLTAQIHTSHTYIIPSYKGFRLTQCVREDLAKVDDRIWCQFRVRAGRKGKKSTQSMDYDEYGEWIDTESDVMDEDSSPSAMEVH